MSSYDIPDAEPPEIRDSHARGRRYGVTPDGERNRSQKRLSSKELAARMEENRDFSEAAISQIGAICRLVAGAGFAFYMADRDGYILHLVGDDPTVEKLRDGNCVPGCRWTEKEARALSLALARRIPVQIGEEGGLTGSACPVFDPDDRLMGGIAISGETENVHPHTLGMVITAARSVENRLRVRRTSEELSLCNARMSAVIDAIDGGVMVVDKDGVITEINDKGKQILQWETDIAGTPLSMLFDGQLDWRELTRPGVAFANREVCVRSDRRGIRVICTAKPVFDTADRLHGIIVVLTQSPLASETPDQNARYRQGDDRRLDVMEKEAIRDILEYTAFNLTSTASILGISRSTLYNKMKKYRLSKDSKASSVGKQDASDSYTVI